jgi:hypothetical protein
MERITEQLDDTIDTIEIMSKPAESAVNVGCFIRYKIFLIGFCCVTKSTLIFSRSSGTGEFMTLEYPD